MMNYVRGVIFLCGLCLVTLVVGLLFLPFLLLPIKWAKIPAMIWLNLLFFGVRYVLGIRLVVEGKQNIPTGGALIASKHQSMLDVLIPWRLFSFPALILKQELSWIPIFGWYVMKLKNIAIDRKGGAAALRSMRQISTKLAREGRQILIFPEGTRVAPGTKIAYKSGVAALYLEMGVPCVPIALNTGLCWPARGLNFKPGVVTVRILPVIEPGLDRSAFMAQLEHQIETATDELLQTASNENTK